jgi:UDP-3-O-[3-hydroxymyristoyl] glucosamine N-acyltransferase
MASITLQEIARHVGGTLRGPAELEIVGIAPADVAAQGFMTFAENEAYLQKALASEASALLIPRTEVAVDRPHVQVDHVRVAFAKILALLHPEPKPIAGIHPSAVVDPWAGCRLDLPGVCRPALQPGRRLQALSTGDPLCGYDAG